MRIIWYNVYIVGRPSFGFSIKGTSDLLSNYDIHSHNNRQWVGQKLLDYKNYLISQKAQVVKICEQKVVL